MTPICDEDVLKDALPHGSGIDCDWNVSTLKNGSVVAHNSYHGMNDCGMYDGWQDFTVKLFRHTADKLNPLIGPSAGKIQVIHRKGDVDFKLSFTGGLCRKNWAYGLRDYLEESIQYSLSEAKILTSRSCEIIDAV